MLLNKLGNDLLWRHDDSTLRMISKANGSADALVRIILDTFPGFPNYINLDAPGVTPSHGCKAARGVAPTLVVHFHKQVQMAVADLWLAMGHRRCRGGGSIHGCASLTTLAS